MESALLEIVEVLRSIHSELGEIKQNTAPVSYSTFQNTTFAPAPTAVQHQTTKITSKG